MMYLYKLTFDFEITPFLKEIKCSINVYERNFEDDSDFEEKFIRNAKISCDEEKLNNIFFSFMIKPEIRKSGSGKGVKLSDYGLNLSIKFTPRISFKEKNSAIPHYVSYLSFYISSPHEISEHLINKICYIIFNLIVKLVLKDELNEIKELTENEIKLYLAKYEFYDPHYFEKKLKEQVFWIVNSINISFKELYKQYIK